MSEETIPQMRETIERLSKDKSGLAKQVEDQAKALRNYEAADAFRAAGYNPNHGKLFAALHPDGEITAEAVTAFADEQGLAPVQASTQESEAGGGDDTSQASDGMEAAAALAGGGSRAGDGGAGGSNVQTLTRAQWQDLHASDPAAARAAVASGRVDISRDNVYVRQAGGSQAPGNPYDNFGRTE